MTRREQWIRFYEAALSGTADFRVAPGESADGHRTANWLAEQAERTADAAMARLDARDFPEPKARALLLTARIVCAAARHNGTEVTVPAHLLAPLCGAVVDFTGDDQ